MQTTMKKLQFAFLYVLRRIQEYYSFFQIHIIVMNI